MRLITIVALLVVLFMGVVYGTLSATGNDRVDMNGKIIGICDGNLQGECNSSYSVLVEGISTGKSENQNISVRITKNTTIVYKRGNMLVNATLVDLKPGQSIEVKFAGTILQTYPPQANASQIIILK